jgi:hypothetical protein
MKVAPFGEQKKRRAKKYDSILEGGAPPRSPHNQRMVASQSNKRQPKYAKNAKIGDTVHSKVTDIMVDRLAKSKFGSNWQKKIVSGVITAIKTKEVKGRNVLFYEVRYELPFNDICYRDCRALKCYPGRYVDPTPPPEVPLFGREVSPTAQPEPATEAIEATNEAPDSPNLLADGFSSSITTNSSGSITRDPRQYSPQAVQPHVPPPVPILPSLIDTAPVDPLCSTDDIDWYCDVTTVKNNMNGNVPKKVWGMKDRSGAWMTEGVGPQSLLLYLNLF